jgi:hypothetical protein
MREYGRIEAEQLRLLKRYLTVLIPRGLPRGSSLSNTPRCLENLHQSLRPIHPDPLPGFEPPGRAVHAHHGRDATNKIGSISTAPLLGSQWIASRIIAGRTSFLDWLLYPNPFLAGRGIFR